MDLSPYEQRVWAELKAQMGAYDLAKKARQMQTRRRLLFGVTFLAGLTGIWAGVGVAWGYGVLGYALLIGSTLAYATGRHTRSHL
jgi:hypothetical protein